MPRPMGRSAVPTEKTNVPSPSSALSPDTNRIAECLSDVGYAISAAHCAHDDCARPKLCAHPGLALATFVASADITTVKNVKGNTLFAMALLEHISRARITPDHIIASGEPASRLSDDGH